VTFLTLNVGERGAQRNGVTCNTLVLNTSTHVSMTKLGVFTKCHFNTIKKKMCKNLEIFEIFVKYQ